ncbi:MAG: recombinase family protein [Clostridia bacterium]|nr:recombinase family protein [Clostridia bacterium]
MDENDIFNKLIAITAPQLSIPFGEDENAAKIAEHRAWLKTIRHERPSTNKEFKVGVYIRYFNQTKHENYLDYHIKQFRDTLSLCSKWQLIDFYVDEGASPPNMESAAEWSRLLCDAMDGKIDLIITQKVSNVSKKPEEITICSRLLAAQNPPIGIYFISEDIFTLASYYMSDLKDTYFFPDPDWKILPDNNDDALRLIESRRQLND